MDKSNVAADTGDTKAANTQVNSGDTLLSGGNKDVSVTPPGDKAVDQTPTDKSTDVKAPDVTKVADDKKPDDKKPEDKKADGEKKDDKKPEGAPETYVDFKLPEGVTLDKDDAVEFTALAKEKNLSQEDAQKFVDMAAKNAAKVLANQSKQWADARANWKAELKADPEVGGDKSGDSLKLATKALRWIGDPKLSEVFDCGWGDHPALFKAFVKVGRALSEDHAIDGVKSEGQPKTFGQVMYPNMK